MSDPCPCGRAGMWPKDQSFPSGKPGELVPYCHVCWRASRAGVAVDQLAGVEQRKAERKAAAKAKPDAPKPCIYFEDAERVPGTKLVQLGLNPLADFRLCEHPDKPLGEMVCSCRGCGPGCGGYSPPVGQEAATIIS